MSRLSLADGDRIVVPLLGPTVSNAGLVRSPGIYELPAGQKSISARALTALAGCQEVRGLYRTSVMRVGPDGRTEMVPLKNDAEPVGDSEILFVQFGADQIISRATLSGGTGLAGIYPVTEGSKLSDMLKAPGALGENPYTLIGRISRRDPRTLLRSPSSVLPGSGMARHIARPFQGFSTCEPLRP